MMNAANGIKMVIFCRIGVLWEAVCEDAFRTTKHTKYTKKDFPELSMFRTFRIFRVAPVFRGQNMIELFQGMTIFCPKFTSSLFSLFAFFRSLRSTL